MKKQTIKIPEGYKIDKVNSDTGEVTFAKLPDDIRSKINGWLYILKHHNMTQERFDEWCKELLPHEVGRRKCEMIVACYNGRQLNDPLPKFGPNTHRKYQPWFEMPNDEGARFAFDDNVCVTSGSYVGARLVFDGEESYENMKDATRKFLKEYEEMLTL